MKWVRVFVSDQDVFYGAEESDGARKDRRKTAKLAL